MTLAHALRSFASMGCLTTALASHRHPLLHSRSAHAQNLQPGGSMNTPQPNNLPQVGTSFMLRPQNANVAQQGECTFSGPSCASNLLANKASCSNIIISDCQVPGGTTLDLTRLADGTQVTFDGTTTFGTASWTGPLVAISGNGLTITGTTNSVLDGNGASYWDNLGEEGPPKPKFFAIRAMRGSNIDGITLLNTPVQAFSISNVQDLTMTNCIVDNRAGEGAGAKNTDGFNVGSSEGVTIEGARVWNQDDCIAVNSGTSITFTDSTCHAGNGLSFGSVGGRENNDLINVVFQNTQVIGSQNGVRIKTNKGTTGSVQGCTFDNIILQDITDFGIIIDQSYPSKGGNPTAGVPITGLTVQGVQGNVLSDGINVFINCAPGACEEWVWSGNQVTGGQDTDLCMNVPPPASCANGGQGGTAFGGMV